MHYFLLSTLLLAAHLAVRAQDASSALVEIEKQKLIKFPDDFDPSERQQAADAAKPEKVDEAKRILEQIAKVNEAFGYVKKQPEQKKLPPILDSSQYLFPKPAYQPFHAQQHHFAGSNGQTLLEPSIRAVKLTRQDSTSYNVPPPRLSTTSTQKPNHTQLYYRPSQVQLPKPSNAEEAKQLPAHFAIPVRLFKLNKEQYLRENAPQEYRIKGYKIIGDVDSFYGKAKSMLRAPTKNQPKGTPKYHLFFLPRELGLKDEGALLNTDDSVAPSIVSSNTTISPPSVGAPSKEARLEETKAATRDKLNNRPFRVQASSSTSNTQNATNINTQTQITRKRIKPLKNKETQVNAVAEQHLPGGGTATLSSNIKITTPSLVTQGAQTTTATARPNRNRITLNPFRVPTVNLSQVQNQTSTAIKNAFQNIFYPFRTPATTVNTITPGAVATQPLLLQSIPLQHPPQQVYITQDSAQEDYKWDDEKEGGGDGAVNSSSDSDDTVERLENNVAELDSSVSAEKHLFVHKAQHLMGGLATAQQGTQKQALREGGIIIQRLKVRKGGIAIAGPGGVATAGSGGTAIVGPGGYALTHPRSLTIAGPGAKVIAIPADVDLKDALQRTNLEKRTFPREGKVVATGPTVYYAPPTGTVLDSEETEQEEA